MLYKVFYTLLFSNKQYTLESFLYQCFLTATEHSFPWLYQNLFN